MKKQAVDPSEMDYLIGWYFGYSHFERKNPCGPATREIWERAYDEGYGDRLLEDWMSDFVYADVLAVLGDLVQ